MSHIYSEYTRQMNNSTGHAYSVNVMRLSWLLSYEQNVHNLMRAHSNGRNVLNYKPAHRGDSKYDPVNYNDALQDVQMELKANNVTPSGNHGLFEHLTSADIEQLVNS